MLNYAHLVRQRLHTYLLAPWIMFISKSLNNRNQTFEEEPQPEARCRLLIAQCAHVGMVGLQQLMSWAQSQPISIHNRAIALMPILARFFSGLNCATETVNHVIDRIDDLHTWSRKEKTNLWMGAVFSLFQCLSPWSL